MRISDSLNAILVDMFNDIKRRQNEYVTVEHTVLALLKNKNIEKLLIELDVDVDNVKKIIDDYLEQYMEKVELKENSQPLETPAFQRVTQNMFSHISGIGKDEADEVDMLVASFDEEESYSIQVLSLYIDKLALIEYITELEEDEEVSQNPSESLSEFAFDMVAHSYKYDDLIGRDNELQRTIEILARRKKNNPILVGEAGVGKSAVVEGLAKAIESGNVPELLQDKKVFSLDLGALISGTKYRGEFEKRLKSVLKEMKKYREPILFIDEIHMIVGAGATGNGSMDVANLLKPALARGEIRCVGATTYDEYKNVFEKDKALSRRFQKIDIKEPSIDDTIKILKGLKDKYEEFHGVKYLNEALSEAVILSKKYLHEKYLPDSAIDLIDEVGAKFKLKKRKNIRKVDIEEVVSQIANIPKEVTTTDEIEKLKTLEEKLKSEIYGQDAAIKEIVKVVKRKKAGLTRDNKPIGSFLFVGSTGVGKTELSIKLSEIMGVNFEKFDMSEYQEAHSVAKLIGAPPGYVGYEKGGLLTEKIRKNPYTVLLLDEIEKAHPDIVQILLQAMDSAKISDSDGRSADFRNVILIMTSNLGVGEGSSIGFGNEKDDFKEAAIERFFAPEFINRLDAIIRFKPLSENSIMMVVDKFLADVIGKLKLRNVELEVTKNAKKELAKRGISPKFGARPLARVIENDIVEPLSDELLFGSLKNGGSVKVDFKKEFVFEVK
jgi:ATP-dependent Clp protease ATP-binding subunit ClpA